MHALTALQHKQNQEFKSVLVRWWFVFNSLPSWRRQIVARASAIVLAGSASWYIHVATAVGTSCALFNNLPTDCVLHPLPVILPWCLQQSVSQAQQQCADEEAERVQLLERAKEKQAALEAAEALAQARLQEIAAAEQAHQHTKGQLAAAQKDLQTLNSERDELLQQQGSTSAAAANLHAKVQELQIRVAQLQAEVDGGQQEAALLKQQLAAQSGALRTLQEQHSSSTQELAVLREQANKLRSDKVHLEIREAEQSATVVQLREELHHLRQQADAARKESAATQRAADDAARDAAAAAAHAKVTEAQLAALTAQQQQVQSALEQQAAEAATLRARAAEAAGRAAQLEEQLTEVRREMSAAQTLAERHAGEAAVGIAKMKSAEALCIQLQEDNRKQVRRSHP